MKKLLLIFLLAAVLALSACVRPNAETMPTIATPPSIQTNQTPLELLTQAVDNARAVDAFTVQYGTIKASGDDSTKDLHTQQVSPERPFDWDSLYTAVPDFPTNEHFLSDFCAGPLQAVPSNTGTIRYERTQLTNSEMNSLMYGQSSDTDIQAEIIGTIAIEVDKNNRFSKLEFILAQYEEDTLQASVTYTLFVTFPA